MAIRKKAKARSKSKVKRRKAAPPARKPARKAPARRAAPSTARRRPARAKAIKPRPAVVPERPAPGERIGVVTHFYGAPSVAVIKLETGTLRIGDTIHVLGHTTDFSQRVESLQVEHAPVAEVGPGDDFGVKVAQHVREHDVVYKVTS